MKGIAIAGTIIVDRINEISRYPERSELTKILSIKNATGGLVPNVAVDIKRLDKSVPVYAFGRVGCDSDGDFALELLRREGIDTDGVSVGSLRTSFTEVMSEIGGQRTFFTYPGSSSNFGADDIELDADKIGMLHLGYFLLLDKVDAGDGELILKAAKKKGIRTSIDLVSENSDRYSIVRPLLKYVDNLIVNELEAGKIAGLVPTEENIPKIMKELLDLGVCERVIIHKTECSYLLSHKGFVTLPSFDLPSGFIKGTTGAGDAFSAGCLYAIYKGLSDTEILRFGSIAALGALREADSISGMADFGELEMLSSGFQRI